MLIRHKRRLLPLISKDHIWVNACIQVLDTKLFHFILESRDTLTTPIIGAASLGVMSAITIDVHVSVRAPLGGAVQEDSPVYVAAIIRIAGSALFSFESFSK